MFEKKLVLINDILIVFLFMDNIYLIVLILLIVILIDL